MGSLFLSDETCRLCGSEEGDVVYERRYDTLAEGHQHLRLKLCTCGFLFRCPRPQEVRPSPPPAPASLWRSRAEGARATRTLERRLDFVEDLLGGAPAGRLLDLGASSGEFLTAFRREDWDRVGLEPCAPAADRARARGVDVQEAPLEAHGLASHGFDLVTCFGLLEHVQDVRVAMERMAELVRPGGLLVVETRDASTPLVGMPEFYAPDHLSHFTRDTLVALAVQHGFAPERTAVAPESGLLVGLRQVGDAARAALPHADREALREIVLAYAREREDYEQELVASLARRVHDWKRAGTRVAIYGAGEHTRFLLERLDLDGCLVGILDSDPTKHGRPFGKWRIASPVEAPVLGATTVLVSSWLFQEEMVDALLPLIEAHGIDIARCYPRASAGAREAA